MPQVRYLGITAVHQANRCRVCFVVSHLMLKGSTLGTHDVEKVRYFRHEQIKVLKDSTLEITADLLKDNAFYSFYNYVPKWPVRIVMVFN